MAMMNRLSPLIVRRVGPMALAASLSVAEPYFSAAESAAWIEDIKLFATAWIGGLIFFGTLLG